MKIAFRLLAVFSLLVCVKAKASLRCEEGLWKLVGVSAAQIEAMARAKDWHGLAVLQGEIDGVPRTIVLLGESHLQNEAQLEAARALLNTFPVRGVESYPGGLLWKIYRSLVYEMEGLLRGKTAGSNITQARRHVKLVKQAARLAERYRLASLGETERQALRLRLDGRVVDGNEVLTLSKLATEIEVFRLEAGFRPNWREWFASWMLTSYYTAPKLGWLPGVVAVPKLLSGDLEATMAWMVVGGASYIASMMGTMFYMETAGKDLKVRRDPWMAASLYNKLSESPQRETVLGIVGRNHLAGISQWLRERGFKEVVLSFPPTE